MKKFVDVEKINFSNMWIYFCAIPCFFMMLVTSRGFTEIKTILLLATTFFCFANLISKKNNFIRINHLIFFTFFIAYVMISLTIGIAKGFKWSLSVDGILLSYYVFTPIIILIISSFFISNSNYIPKIINVLRYITLFIVFMNVWKLLAYKGVVPDIDLFNLFYISSGLSYDELSLRISNEHNLIYLLPFFTVMFYLEKSKKNKYLDLVIIFFGAIYCVLSGRKMLELIFGCVFILMIFYSVFFNKIKNLFSILFVVFFIILFLQKIAPVLGISNIIDLAYNTLINGLSNQSFGIRHRLLSSESLIRLWNASPIFGNGLNSYGDYVASTTTMWSYEIFYVAFLAQTGLLGVALFFGGIWCILKNLIKRYLIYSDPIFLATFMGMICFVISGSSNPMLYIPWPWILSISLSCYEKPQINFCEKNDFPSSSISCKDK